MIVEVVNEQGECSKMTVCGPWPRFMSCFGSITMFFNK